MRIVDDLGERNGAVSSRYDLMKGWGTQPTGLLRTMLSKDAFHMSDRGYGCLAQNLAADLAPLLPRQTTNTVEKSASVGSITSDKLAPGVSVVK